MPIDRRFALKVAHQEGGECLLWTGYIDKWWVLGTVDAALAKIRDAQKETT